MLALLIMQTALAAPAALQLSQQSCSCLTAPLTPCAAPALAAWPGLAWLGLACRPAWPSQSWNVRWSRCVEGQPLLMWVLWCWQQQVLLLVLAM